MSRVLIIRHLPLSLSFQDKEQLLKHFGAEKVWETGKNRNYIFASFSTETTAKSSLTRLHQLEIAQKRLVVEYSAEKEPITSKKTNLDVNSVTTRHVKDFLNSLNAWSPSVNFYNPPPPHLKYEYPEISPNTVINIIRLLYSHKPLYVQTLHLMNKMSLEIPFDENEKAVEFFRETFRSYFVEEISLPPIIPSEPESEISSDEMEKSQQPVYKLMKRKHTLPITRKRPAAILSTASLPKPKRSHLNQEEVFEVVTPIVDTKKISLVVQQDALQKNSAEPEVIGELGKFQKEETPQGPNETMVEKQEKPTITKKELLKNRISYRDMKILPVFKNYHPGQPSMRLYIKNLAKTVTEQDVHSIYKRYIEHISDEEQTGFDVRVMQEGRMKGQAFVTFPSENIATTALNETNGYILKEKPMVVQFARVATQKKS